MGEGGKFSLATSAYSKGDKLFFPMAKLIYFVQRGCSPFA